MNPAQWCEGLTQRYGRRTDENVRDLVGHGDLVLDCAGRRIPCAGRDGLAIGTHRIPHTFIVRAPEEMTPHLTVFGPFDNPMKRQSCPLPTSFGIMPFAIPEVFGRSHSADRLDGPGVDGQWHHSVGQRPVELAAQHRAVHAGSRRIHAVGQFHRTWRPRSSGTNRVRPAGYQPQDRQGLRH